jgi:cyanate permease
VAGAGAAMMSVVLTKMLTDWFAGNRDRNGDLYQFLAGWHRAVAAAAAAALHTPWRQRCASRRSRLHRQLHAAARDLPPRATGYCAVPTCKSAPRPWCRRGARHDGLIWGFFNIGFAMIFSFGPSMLVEHGWSIAAAGSTISIVLWISAVTVPLGGFLADRFRRPQQIIVVSCVAFGALLLVLPRSGAVIATVMALGAISGLPAGPIMSLPAKVLQPGTRAIGMGLFFTVFYVCMMLGPAAAGAIGKWAGSAASALDFGAAMILACPLLLWLGNRIPQFTTKPA